MLTYTNRKTSNIAPIDFDYKALGQATNLLLGKAKTDILLKDTSPKGILKLIGELENEARSVRKDPKKDFPPDNTFRRSKEELENLRDQMVRDIFGFRNLWAKQNLKNSLPYRIRSKNQLDSISSNKIEQIGKETENGTEITARVSLEKLPSLIKDAEATGYAKVSFPVTNEDIEFVKNKLKTGNVTLTFRDELAERPEIKRIILGNQNSRAQRLAREKKTSPRTEILNIADSYTGQIVILSNNSKVTNVSERQTPNGIELEVELMFPEVLLAFEKNGRDSGGDGVISDGRLKNHCSNAYGCNGRDFLESVTEVTEALRSNLKEAAQKWSGKEDATPKEIENFLEEYSILSLCLRHEPTSPSGLEPARSLVKSVADLSRGLSLDNNKSFETGPENAFSTQMLQDTRINMPASASTIAGNDWVNNLIENEVNETYRSPRGQNYAKEIEETYKIKGASQKMESIERNFWASPAKNEEQTLDGGPKNLELTSHYLSNEREEEYELEKEEQEQEIFNAKAEYAMDMSTKVKKQTLDKADWIQNRKPITLSLPYNGQILHRLTRYPNRASGLTIKASRGDKFDPETSLASKEIRRIPSKPDGKPILISDCLSNEGQRDLERIKTIGSEQESEEIKRISLLLEQWQSSLRRLSPSSKNPLEAKVLRWLEAIAQNDTNSKALSIGELSTMLGTSISQSGRIPYESERSTEHFSMPTRSNPLPLKLLCGTGFEEIKGLEVVDPKKGTQVLREDAVANDPAKLWDTVIRWQNAENLHEMQLEAKAPVFLEELEAMLNSEDATEEDLIKHAVKVELSGLPYFKEEYLENLGFNGSIENIPKDFRPLADIFYPIESSPLTATIKGEETPIDGILGELESQGLKITLTTEEEEEIKNAPALALQRWQDSISTIVANLNSIDASTNKDVEIELILSSEPLKTTPTDESNLELDPFMESIALLHQEIPQSEEDLKDVLKSLITHNPPKVKVNTPEGSIDLIRGSNNIWSSKSKNTQTSKALELFNKAQELIAQNGKRSPDSSNEDVQGLNQEDQLDPTYLEAKAEARKTRLFENIEELPKVLNAIPKELANSQKIKELCQPLNILATQVIEAKKASELGESLIKGWMGAPEEKENPWGWDQAILNPVGSIEYLCDKITGKKENAIQREKGELNELNELNRPENKATYFTHTLIRDSEKIEAVERLRNNGSVVAGNYLIESLNHNLLAIKSQASQSLPALMGDLEQELNQVLEKSQQSDVKEFICGDSPVKQLLEDKTKYRILESKIREAAKELLDTKGTVRTIDTVNKGLDHVQHTQVGRDILKGADYKITTNLEINKDTNLIKTNKIWAASWLNSKIGKESLAQRINLNNWLKTVTKSSDISPKTAIAFLEFCKHRSLLNIPTAISCGKMNTEEEKVISSALVSFKQSLSKICVDPTKSDFKTQLVASYALNQYIENNRNSKLWNKEIEQDLERISSNIKKPNVKTSFEIKAVLATDLKRSKQSIPSPFLRKKEIVAGIDLEEDIEKADPKTKLRTVVKAVSVLYKAIPTEKSMGKKPKTKAKTKEKVQSIKPNKEQQLAIS